MNDTVGLLLLALLIGLLLVGAIFAPEETLQAIKEKESEYPAQTGEYVLAWDNLGKAYRVGKVKDVNFLCGGTISFLPNPHEERISPNFSTRHCVPAESIRMKLTSALLPTQLIPSWYYKVDLFPDKRTPTLFDLEDFLATFSQPREYRRDVFDCSEAAAYMERMLEDAGFDARIAVGPAPFDPSSHHAWILVYFGPRDYVAVEPTRWCRTSENIWRSIEHLFRGKVLGIVYPGDFLANVWGYYHGYEKVFYDIYTASLAYPLDEWDWWKSTPR